MALYLRPLLKRIADMGMGTIPTHTSPVTTIERVKGVTTIVIGTLIKASDIVTPMAESTTVWTISREPIIMTNEFTFGSNSK